MKRTVQKCISLLLVPVMCVGIISTAAFADGSTGTAPTQIVDEGGKIYYLAGGAEADAMNFDVWTSKTIAETGTENMFEITLQVGTTKTAKTEDVAVVLVMDVSSSMLKDKRGKWAEYGTAWKDYLPVEGPLMIDYARESAQEFVAGLVDHAGDASIKLAMVEFGNNARTVVDWTEANDNGNVDADIMEAIERLDVGFAIGEIENEPDIWDINITEASFWAPARNETGRCYYKHADGSYCELTDPFHTHNSTGADLCYWVARNVSYISCTSCATCSNHTHSVYDCWTAGSCSYPGCTDDKKHKHALYFLTCNYIDENGEVCTLDGYHTHKEEGHCTYIFDNTPCTDTTPFHYHKFTLSDVDAANNTFGWNTDGSMYSQRYLLTDENGVNHLCVDYEILRQKSCGTNMEGGLLLASNLLDAGLAEGGAIEDYENVYVVMLSDGEPTWHVAPEADRDSLTFVPGQRGTSSKTEWIDIRNIVSDGTEGDVAYAEDIKENAALYTVMYGYVGDTVIPNAGTASGFDAKPTVKNWLTGTGKNMVGIDDLYMAEDVENGLMEQFGNIGERIEILSKAWTVTDALSDEVIFAEFGQNGEYAEYDEDAHAITWHVGDMEPEKADAAGTCEDPYVYTLKYRVKLDPNFDGVYEASADGRGINTNKGVTLYYIMTYDGEDLKKLAYDELASRAKEAAFDHPAVKAFYADYAFTKISSATGNALEGAGFTLYKDGNVWTEEIFSDASGNVKFEKLSVGSYELVESTVPADMQEMDSIEFVVSYGEMSKKDGGNMPAEIYNDSLIPDAAVVLTIDMSGTMYRFKMDGKRYVDVAKAKALDFVEQYAASVVNDGDKRMLAIAAFDTDAKVVLNWVDVGTASGFAAANKAIGAIKVADNGSTSSNQVCTNFDGGVILTRNMLKQSAVQDIDKKFAIILSDGAPTVTVNEDTDVVGTIKSSFWGDQKDEWGKTYQIRRYGGGWTHPAEVAHTLRYMATGSNNLADLTVNYRTEDGDMKEGIFIIGVGGDMSFKLFDDAVYGTSNGSRSADVKKKPAAFNSIDALQGYTQAEILNLTAGDWMGILADRVDGTYESANNAAALQAQFDKIIEVIKDVTNP